MSHYTVIPETRGSFVRDYVWPEGIHPHCNASKTQEYPVIGWISETIALSTSTKPVIPGQNLVRPQNGIRAIFIPRTDPKKTARVMVQMPDGDRWFEETEFHTRQAEMLYAEILRSRESQEHEERMNAAGDWVPETRESPKDLAGDPEVWPKQRYGK